MTREVFIPGLRRILRLGGTTRAVASEVDDELRFHLESRAAELQAEGLTEDAAMARAAQEFGDLPSARSELVEVDRRRLGRDRRGDWWESIVQDVRYALRGLAHSPGFTAAVVLTLALGIGANATMFGVVDRLLFRAPDGLVAPEQVGTVNVRYTDIFYGDQTNGTFSYPMFQDLRERNRTFQSLAAMGYPVKWSVGSGENAEALTGTLVTEDYFALIGLTPALGRFPAPDEFAPPNGTPVLVVSWGYWQRRFAGDANVIGKRLTIGNNTYTIIGVAPRGFAGVSPYTASEAWMPVAAGGPWRGPGDQWATDMDFSWIQVIGRLKPGVTREQAASDIGRVWRTSTARRKFSSDSTSSGVLGSLIPGRDTNGSPYVRVSKLIAAVSVLVLLIACANVANLLLARALRRRQEVAVRLALGVGRGRLIRMLLIESLIIAICGGAGALLVVYWGGGLLSSLLLSGAAAASSLVSSRVLIFATIVSITAGVLIGLVPAIQGSTPELTEALKGGGREGGGRRSRMRNTLVAVQAALSVILLVGMGLFVRSLHNVSSQRLGFDAQRVLVGQMNLRGRSLTTVQIDELFHRMAERVDALPGVTAAVSAGMPFSQSYAVGLKVPGLDTIPRAADGGPYIFGVTPSYLKVLGTRLLRGRDFAATDDVPGAPPVVIVSELMARRFWPDGNAIGRCMIIGADTMPCSTVIGVVEDVRRGSLEPEDSFMYFVPLAQAPAFMQARTLVARAEGDPGSAAERVRREMQSAAAGLPFADVRQLSTYLDRAYRPWRLGAATFTAFGVLALLLATLGTYAVLSYSVTQRAHEMGVRIALGAQTRDVLRLVVTQGIAVTAAAAVIGLAAALALGRFAEPLLFQVTARDPAVFAGAAAVVLLSAAAASLIPALRAARVDPVASLRDE